MFTLLLFVLHIVLTRIRKGSANKWYRNTVKDLLLPNTVNQKDAKPYTAGLDDIAIPHIEIKNTEIALEKKHSIPQYREPPCPPLSRFSCYGCSKYLMEQASFKSLSI